MKIFILIFFFFEKFGNLEFFQGIENLDFFFWRILNFFKELKILNIFWKKPKKYESNAPSPKAFFENFVFFFFLKYEDLFIIKKWRRWRWRWSKSDEDLFMMIFFFEKPILWMRITLARSWCGLLDKSLLNSCKKIISISNGFIHWNELEVLTQCP